MNRPDPLPSASTIGILGGGQLGRMLAVAAARFGYRVHIYAPEASGPARDVSGDWTQGRWDDAAALARFAASVDLVTYEFENVPAAAIAALGDRIVRPGAQALEIAQDRLAEKDFARALGGRTAPYRVIDGPGDIAPGLAALGGHAILKTRRMGYDGKGQARLGPDADPEAAWRAVGGQPAILEGLVRFDAEFSIIVARAVDGATESWSAPDNVHKDGVLDTSTVPPRPAIAAQEAEARALALRIAGRLDYVGVLACEFFAGADGPVFNEMAPRVHNSGHWTIEGALTSQFENHIRAICGLPLGATTLTAERVVMENLLGAQADGWLDILADPAARLHLYGKAESLPGRKMGHVTRLG